MIYELLASDPLYITDKQVADTLLAMLRGYVFNRRGLGRDTVLEYHIPDSIQRLWSGLSDESRVIAYMTGNIAYDKWMEGYEG
jgi:hypothetical protein